MATPFSSESPAPSVRGSAPPLLRRLPFAGTPLPGAFPRPAAADAGDVTLWWLGQAGFAVRHGDRLLLIDPYLSESLAEKYRGRLFPHTRMHPSPVGPEELRGVTDVLCTHAHTDHMDPWTIHGLLRYNEPRFVVPLAERERAHERGVPAGHTTCARAGDPIDLDGITIGPVPAAHEHLEWDDRGNHRFLGYVLTVAGLRIYHSGDCVPYDGQPELLRELRIDLALLPVNGRDAHRRDNGVPGNFTAREAAELCEAAGIPYLLCHHFGLFDFNTVDAGHLRDELNRHATSLRWTVPQVGDAFVVTPGAQSKGTA